MLLILFFWRKDILTLIDLLHGCFIFLNLFLFIYFDHYLICNMPFQYHDKDENLCQ